MGSIPAEQVAKEVLETIGKGKIPNMGKIAIKKGYSKAVAKNPQQIRRSKSYQRVMDPLITKLEEEREAIIKRLKSTRNKAKYRDLIDGLDKITKNIQLIGGKPTDISSIVVDEERKDTANKALDRFLAKK